MARNLSNAAASLLPYSTIEAAASGNVDAINAVLKHYERYIAALATRTLYDENVFRTFASMKKRYAGCEPSCNGPFVHLRGKVLIA